MLPGHTFLIAARKVLLNVRTAARLANASAVDSDVATVNPKSESCQRLFIKDGISGVRYMMIIR